MDLGAVPSTSSLRSYELRLAGQPAVGLSEGDRKSEGCRAVALAKAGLHRVYQANKLGGETAFDMR